MPLPSNAHPVFVKLLKEYKNHEIRYPQLKAVTCAQWGLESGWGTSGLAKHHFNFGGAKWRPYMNPWASPVSYKAHDGETIYCEFDTLGDWINGYWGRFIKERAYKGWDTHTKTAENFITFIGPIWLGMGDAKGDEYVLKVLRIMDYYKLEDEFDTEKKNEIPQYSLDDLAREFPNRL